MGAVLPHYSKGPASKQVSALTYGGQFVMATTPTPGTTDFTVKPAVPVGGDAAGLGTRLVLGVAGIDAAPVTTQTGGANSYGQPLIDISVLPDYTSVYYDGYDIPVWYAGPAAEGDFLVIGGATSGGTVTAGTVTGIAAAAYNSGSSTAITVSAANIIARCTVPGGVSAGMLTQQIGGAGTAAYYLGRARLIV